MHLAYIPLCLSFLQLVSSSALPVDPDTRDLAADALRRDVEQDMAKKRDILDAQEEKRAACNHDNVLRALIQNSAAASPFCKTYAHIPISTVLASVPFTYQVREVVETVISITYAAGFPTQVTSPLPTYVSAYPTSRISSGCSCLVPPPTVTVTAETETFSPYSSIVTSTTTTSSSYTVPPNFCTPLATPFLGEYSYGPYQPGQFEAFTNDATPQDCCNSCFVNPAYENCVAWMFMFGSCHILESANASYPNHCPNGFQSGSIFANEFDFGNNVGGVGRCASEISLVQEMYYLGEGQFPSAPTGV